jgi:glycerol uptake facilitator-like aquaporin
MKFKIKVSRTSLIESLSEFFGTWILLMALLLSSLILRGNEPLLVAIIYIVIIATFSNFSKGHFNPLFTLADLFSKIFSAPKDRKLIVAELKTAGMYLVVQFLAALAAYLVVARIQNAVVDFQIIKAGMEITDVTKQQVIAQIAYANTFLASSWKLAFFLETLFSFVLGLVYLINYYGEKSKTTLAMAVGLAFFAVEVFVSDISGGSFHMFKSLVSAMFTGGESMSNLWVYLLAGTLGALMAGLVYVAFDKLSKVAKK